MVSRCAIVLFKSCRVSGEARNVSSILRTFFLIFDCFGTLELLGTFDAEGAV